MHTVLTFLAQQPLALLFLLFAVGSALGTVRIFDVQVGPAAVLFTAIALASLATAYDVKLAVPEAVGNLGLVLFTYTVGIISGPAFFGALRTGWGLILTLGGLLIASAIAVAGVGRALGLSGPIIAGSFAGALTNTPALAAATERAGGAAGPTVGYSITYVYGVIAMLIAAAVALRSRRTASTGQESLTNVTIRVERADHPRVREIVAAHHGDVMFSRVAHGEASPILVAEEDDVLREGDLVTVVGPTEAVNEVARELGHPSSHTLNVNGKYLDSRRITLSHRPLAGHTVAELDLPGRFGGTVSRIRRGDQDMVASDDFVLQLGDRLRVIVPASRMKAVATYLGDSERGMSDINPAGLALGLVLGVLLGTIHVPAPGGGFTIGAAAGTLVVGLVFGRLGRIGPLVTGLPRAAASSLSSFGMLAFLAYAGTKAGGSFASAITSGLGWRIALVGFVATSLAALILTVAGRYLHKVDPTRLAGMLAGAQTQPAVLGFANERTGFDARVALGYALMYPAAMIIKILLAQLLAGL